ncbi:MAG TPA: carboxypeptidase-like regulatory domain-containing protein, partial [Thermoanaerobaculia bacterium]
MRTADGKSPVAGAVVKIGAWATATSGEDGTFTIEHVPEKWESVTARSGNLSGRRARGGSLDIRVAPTIDIRGVIQDAKSRVPIAGAVVNIASSARLGAGSAEATVSDEKGNFIIRDVAPGSYNLFANHPSFSFTPVSTTISARDNSMRTVAGTRRARVSGAVTAEDRTAVGGARIVALPAARRDFAPNFFGSNIHMSAPDGTFTILAAPDEDLQIEARKKGFPVARSNTLKLAPGERKNGVVITIPAGLSVTGRVVDREGNPLSGVSVSAAESQDANTSRMMRMQRGRTEDDLVQTSSEGTFALKLKEGTYDLAFRREGFAPKTVRAQRVAAAMDPIDVTLEAGVEITGRVTRNGVGIGDVRVSVFGDAAQESTQTSADGSFRFSDLAPGSLMLSAIKEDEFIQINQPVKAPARDVELKVSPGGRISGRVFDKETKQPVTTFEAGLSGSRGGSGMMFIVPNQMRPFTNDDGSFTLENVPPGAATVVVVGGGYVMGVVSNLKVEEGRVLENVEVGLERGVRVTGRVTGPDGAALSGVAVRITERQQDRFVRPTAFAAAATTDANGQYTIEAVEPGEQTFLFMRSGYAQTEKTEKVAGAEVRVDAQLSAGVRVSGTVVTEAGAPVADAAVSAFTTGAAGGGRSTRTDANGAFQLEGLTPGRYTFRATKPG